MYKCINNVEYLYMLDLITYYERGGDVKILRALLTSDIAQLKYMYKRNIIKLPFVLKKKKVLRLDGDIDIEVSVDWGKKWGAYVWETLKKTPYKEEGLNLLINTTLKEFRRVKESHHIYSKLKKTTVFDDENQRMETAYYYGDHEVNLLKWLKDRIAKKKIHLVKGKGPIYDQLIENHKEAVKFFLETRTINPNLYNKEPKDIIVKLPIR